MKNQFSSMSILTIDPIMQGMYLHPFVVELIDGTLARERFVYYLQQQSRFLPDFARALALAGAKMPKRDDLSLLLGFAEKIMAEHRELRDYYFKKFQTGPAERKGPACFAYSSHVLERAALGSPAEAMAALVPDFWVYRQTGNHIRKHADLDNPYYKWIESYACEEYSLMVDQAVDLLDRLASVAGIDDQQRMFEGFVASCRYEYYLREDAYELRTWHV